MNNSLNEEVNTPFSEFQVPREFDYQDYLQKQARSAALSIGQSNPQPTMFYISHPNETYRHEYSQYQPVGEIYCRKPWHIPPKLLAEFGGQSDLAERYVVCIERLRLDPHFRRRGFLRIFTEELSVQRFRYMILSQIPNHEFASYLYDGCEVENSRIEFLPDDLTGTGEQVRLPTFAVRLY